MARHARRLTISALEDLRRRAESDPSFKSYVADAGQPGLYAWARRGRVRFVFAYRPPAGGARRRLKIDEFGAITLHQAREIAEDWRGMVAAGRDPQLEKREQDRRATTLGQVAGLYLEDLRERAESGAKRGKRSEAEEAGSAHPSALLAIRLLALTGFRRAELLGHTMKDRRSDREGLRWGDIDLNAGLVRLTDSKTGAQTRVVGQAAIRLLEASRPNEVEDLDPVCPGTRPGQPFIGIDKVRVRIYRAAGLAGLPGVDVHSLRHTFASIGAHVHNGRYAAFVSALLGHGYTKKAITERYIHANPEALRPAADAIAEAIATTLGLSGTGRLLAFRG